MFALPSAGQTLLSGPGFEDQVHRRLGRPAEAGEPGLLRTPSGAGPRRPGHRGQPHLLGQRVGRADRQTTRLQQGRHRVLAISRAVVQGERLHQQHGPAGSQVLPSVPGGAHRVAHVVQAVEEADQVVLPGVAGRVATSNRVRPTTPASAARRRAVSTDGAWKSNPQNTPSGRRRPRPRLTPHARTRRRPPGPGPELGLDPLESRDPLGGRYARYPVRKNHSVPQNRHGWCSPQLRARCLGTRRPPWDVQEHRARTRSSPGPRTPASYRRPAPVPPRGLHS